VRVSTVAQTAAAATAEDTAEIEAEYALESPAVCPSCNTSVNTLQVIRLLRTKVNFTSSLPRRGYAIVCPVCRALAPATIGGLLG
jgi:hypothetical protein